MLGFGEARLHKMVWSVTPEMGRDACLNRMILMALVRLLAQLVGSLTGRKT